MRKSYINPQAPKIPGIETVLLSSPKNKYLEAIVHTYKSVWAARRFGPDIVHIHAIGPSVLAPLVRILGMKVVVTNHGPEYQRKKWPFLAKLFLRFCEWAGTICANAVITIAKNLAQDLKKRFGREVFVIPNGVEIPALADEDHALKRFGLDKKNYVLIVGRLVPEKGFDILVDAFNSSRPTKWKLVIVGRADFEDRYSVSLKQKVSENPNIVMTGFLTGNPLHELYSHAGLFVLPSFYEGLPIVLLEAMSYGLSCVASDIPANRNIEMDDQRFFKPGDTESLSRKITHFIEHPLTDEERKKQVRTIAERYDWEKIADQTLYVYKQVLGYHG